MIHTFHFFTAPFLNPFGKFYFFLLMVLGVAFFLGYKAISRQRTDAFIFTKTLYFLTITTLFNWLTLFLSYRRLQFLHLDSSVYRPSAVGGFPFVCFEYPCCALGADYPPFEQWWLFSVNLLCYAIIALGFMYFFRRRILFPSHYTPYLQQLVAIFFVLLNHFSLFYVLFKFD